MIFKLHDPVELRIGPGIDLRQYFTYDLELKKWVCFCGTQIARHHGNRWRHIHVMHPELIDQKWR